MGCITLYKPRNPSCATIFLKQSKVPEYFGNCPGSGLGIVCSRTWDKKMVIHILNNDQTKYLINLCNDSTWTCKLCIKIYNELKDISFKISKTSDNHLNCI